MVVAGVEHLAYDRKALVQGVGHTRVLAALPRELERHARVALRRRRPRRGRRPGRSGEKGVKGVGESGRGGATDCEPVAAVDAAEGGGGDQVRQVGPRLLP